MNLFLAPYCLSIRKTIDTLQLRIQALTNKKSELQNLLQAAVSASPTNNGTRSNIESQLKGLDEVINDASKQMEKYLIMKDMVIPSSKNNHTTTALALLATRNTSTSYQEGRSDFAVQH